MTISVSPKSSFRLASGKSDLRERIDRMRISHSLSQLLAACLFLAVQVPPGAAETRPAKELFGQAKLPSRTASSPIGSYAKGCVAGAVAIPPDGPTWQAMR